jgi:hypothetical protein
MVKKEESKAVVLTEDQKGILFNGYTGDELNAKQKFPPVINILQSDKQYEAFGVEANQITKSMYGKLFVRTGKNSLIDLKDQLEGTVIRKAQGAEFLDIEGNIIGSSTKMIYKNDQPVFLQANPKVAKIRNMIKIILCMKESEEAIAMLNEGISPFAILIIKGSAWGMWGDVQNEMDNLSLASDIYGHKHANEVKQSVFKFTIKSKEEENEKKQKFYVPDITVSLNPLNESLALARFVDESVDIPLFGGTHGIQEGSDSIVYEQGELATPPISSYDQGSVEEVDIDNLSILDRK